MFCENPDFIGVFCYPNAGISRCIFEDVKPLFFLWLRYRTPVQLNIRRRRTSQKLVRRFAFYKPEVLQKTSGFFYFTKKERSKCTSPARHPSTAWRPSCSDRPVEINGAAAGSVGCIRSAKRTAIAGSASTTEKRKAAPWRSARYWMSGYPAAQPLFMKPFMRHLLMHDISCFKDGFHISTTERMMPL